ncbi:MAG: hypothetical protein IT373_36890 [Polyangiaceae bacterium]|nr:hypothetical protein [Polyangiaceae bacterium]
MLLLRTDLDGLDIDDEGSFRHVALYADLKRLVRAARLPFRVAAAEGPLAHWDAVLVLNHTQWTPAQAVEVLAEPRVPADVLCHRAWHYAAAEALGPHAYTADGLLLGEAVASAFDLYLVGRLLGHAPGSSFLESQVEAMRDAADAAGLDAEGFEALLARASAEPERAFESLRALLFDAATGLSAAADVDAAAEVLARAAARDHGPLLYHYELRNWVLFARAQARASVPGGSGARLADPTPEVRAIDAELRAAPDPIAWLDAHWLEPLRRKHAF